MCYFAHPDDGSKWRDARPSGDPPLHYLTDDEYRLIVGHHRSPSRRPPPVATRPPQPYQVRRRSFSIERDRKSPIRRFEREPFRPRTRSRERERSPPSLASRIYRRSTSRERDPRPPYGYRNSRSRSPNVRGRMPARSPPPMEAPRPRPYGMIPDGPRNGPQGRRRSPVIFPKVEAVDMSPRQLLAPPRVMQREDSISSTHVPSHRATPSKIPTGPAAMNGGHLSVNDRLPYPNRSSSAVLGATSTKTDPSLMNMAATAIVTGSSAADAGPSAMDVDIPSTSVAPLETKPTADSIRSLLETSTAEWEQISSAVAAATSAVPKTNLQVSASGEISAEDSQKIWASRIE